MPEFQPREITSFSAPQLKRLISWSVENGVPGMKEEGGTLYNAFVRVVEKASIDEKGKTLDDRGRQRLKLGFSALAKILARGENLNDIRGNISIWQTTPDPDFITVRWTTRNLPSTRNMRDS